VSIIYLYAFFTDTLFLRFANKFDKNSSNSGPFFGPIAKQICGEISLEILHQFFKTHQRAIKRGKLVSKNSYSYSIQPL